MTRPKEEFRYGKGLRLAGRMAVYGSQDEASSGIPEQWKTFLLEPRAEIQAAMAVYGGSPCTPDGKIHYLCGIALTEGQSVSGLEELPLLDGEYVVFTVKEMADVRPTWRWFFEEWLPKSGRKERSAPEFERFVKVAGSAELQTPVELWIPLESASNG